MKKCILFADIRYLFGATKLRKIMINPVCFQLLPANISTQTI